MFRLAGRAIPDLTFLAALGTSYYVFLCLFGYYAVWILAISVMVILLVLFNVADVTVQAASTKTELTQFEKANLALCCLGSFGGIVYVTAFPAFS